MSEHAIPSWDSVSLDPQPAYTILNSFEDYVAEHMDSPLSDVRDWLKQGLALYPELAGETIYVGITHDEITYHGEPHAMADPYNRIIYLNRGCMAEGYQTLCHELMHILIRKEHERDKDVPLTSEEYCSIRTIAKMQPSMLYRDDISYLGEPDVPKDEWPEICQDALDYRANHRNYIQKAKEWLEI